MFFHDKTSECVVEIECAEKNAWQQFQCISYYNAHVL